MVSKIILDANIILDLSLERSKDLENLRKIYTAIIDGKFRCYTTTSIIHICGHWLKQAMNLEAAKEIILSVLNHVRVIDAPHDKVVEALHSDIPDIEDALQYYIAWSHQLDCFISRDKQFSYYGKPQLPIYHPSVFIKKFMN
jgi:predicted nucleic acid-binding protein